jgi:very-short-patch-repair endonuclease
MRKIIPYNPRLKQLARNLRNHSTLSEILLWEHLKNKRMEGYDFHRQKPIGNYIVDFFCPDLMLTIEIDGTSHEVKYHKDQKRQQQLEDYGIRFLRVQDIEVKRNIGSVTGYIQEWIKAHKA